MIGPEPMTCENLNLLGGPGELVTLHSLCHKGAPLLISYAVDEQCLVLICAICRRLSAKIQVAECIPAIISEEVH